MNDGFNNIAPRPTGWFGSRDFVADIKCYNMDYIYNNASRCGCPACVEIDSSGRCGIYISKKEMRKIDGD